MIQNPIIAGKKLVAITLKKSFSLSSGAYKTEWTSDAVDISMASGETYVSDDGAVAIVATSSNQVTVRNISASSVSLSSGQVLNCIKFN